MNELVTIQCAECGEVDEDYWGKDGAENPCPRCKAPSAELFRV